MAIGEAHVLKLRVYKFADLSQTYQPDVNDNQ